MHKIVVKDINVDVVRKNIKDLHFAVCTPSGRARIAPPANLDAEAAKFFAKSKL